MTLSPPFKKFLTFVKRYWKRYAIGIIVLLFTDIFALLTPKVVGFAIDSIKSISDKTPIKVDFYFSGLNKVVENWANALILTKPLKIIFVAGLLIILINVVAGVFRFFWRLFISRTSFMVDYDIRNAYYKKILSLPMDFFSSYSTGEVMARATNDLRAVRMMAGPGILAAFDPLFTALIAIPNMILISGKLTLISLIPFPFICILGAIFIKLIFKKFKQVQEKFSSLTNFSQNSFNGIKIIKSYTNETENWEKFNKESTGYKKSYIKLAWIDSLFHPMIMFFSSIAIVLVLYLGGVATITGNISLGSFYAFTRYLMALVWPMIAIGWVISIWQRGLASMTRVNEIFESKNNIVSGQRIPDKITEIEFKNIWFKYPKGKDWTIKNLSFKIRNDEKISFVGKIGSGKSTIVELILRMYDSQKGKILLNGIDLKEYDLASVRRAIGYVPQDSFLFSESLKDNLILSNEEYPDHLNKVIKYAGLSDTIRNFENGINTIVGEKGVTLSGGQRQRMTIARALYKTPQVLIFDDSFSSIDSDIEGKILDSITNKCVGRMQIFIAHRLSTIQHTDKIYVLKDGNIAEMGRYNDLLEKRGEFFKIYLTQQLKEE